MTGELEDFLRAAAEMRRQRQGPRAGRPPRPAPTTTPPPAGGPRGGGPRASGPPASRPAPSPAPLSSLGGPHLAASLEQTDERVESHLHEVFDHQLGSLTRTALEVAVAGQPLAAQIAALLRHPATMRQAVIVAEVLRSPVERDGDSW